jgi:hypothetical protein
VTNGTYIIFNFPSVGSTFNDRPGIMDLINTTLTGNISILGIITGNTVNSFGSIYGMTADSPGFNNASFVYSQEVEVTV